MSGGDIDIPEWRMQGGELIYGGDQLIGRRASQLIALNRWRAVAQQQRKIDAIVGNFRMVAMRAG